MQSSLFQVGIFQDDSARLTAEFHEHRLQVFARCSRDDAADPCTASEIDLFDMRMSNEAVDDCGRSGRGVEYQVQATVREPGLSKDVRNTPVASWRKLSAFENGGVASCQRKSDRTQSKMVRGVPEMSSGGVSSELSDCGLNRQLTMEQCLSSLHRAA